MPPYLPEPAALGRGRLVVIGAGKASAAMARAVEEHWPGPLSGLVVTRYGYAVPCERIEIVEAAHPVPDAAGRVAAERILERVRGLCEDDLVLCLISGGGSSLLPLPAPGLTLDDKQAVNRALLRSGATIGEMNCVRRHLSAIKGGRLAAACHPARVLTLLDLRRARRPADRHRLRPDRGRPDDLRRRARHRPPLRPSSSRRRCATCSRAARGESVKPGDPRLVARRDDDRRGAAAGARGRRRRSPARRATRRHILGDAIEGEARDVGKVMAAIALQVAEHGQPVPAPCVLLSGGETTVTVRGSGRGGRNVEFLLSLAIALAGHPRIYALAGDTDGVDGQEEIAGALLAPDSLARAWALGMKPLDHLADNDGHGFFAALGDSVVTGPTLTNVNDFRAIVIDAAPAP